ncbi:hypothetical protein Halru_2268 [Halovivax ruber XH-70]|uniref:Uncharacterized protein n=1 Tax=Halovivax ruber (strain DSM 18193 / JCM 13892 / XH-70) TaxID=797302 RepID=L0IDM6_HALRX|nr:hypothetical protein [Halovivax ruber]AGB16854.1 hypothetical protein Halru_2268 [Halovivax ruber XH-70]
MLELVLLLVLLVGVPIVAIAVVTGSAAYVRAGAEKELAAMADESPVDEGESTDDEESPSSETAARSDSSASDR